MPRPLRFLAAILAAALAVPLPAGAAEEASVRIDDNFFFPVFRVVFVDTEVTWVNQGSSQHTVTFYDGSFDSSPNTNDTCNDPNPLVEHDCLEPGQRAGPHTFTAPGTYDYYCKIHSSGDTEPDPDVPAREQPCQMCGRIEVRVEETPEPRPVESRTANPPPVQSPEPSEEPRESADPTPTSTALLDDSPLAGRDQDDGGSGSARAVAAFVLILALSGAGYVTWRKFLAR